MAEFESFTELWKGVQKGDAQAARQLVESYEPAIRRAVRIRMVDARLRGLLDSMDICQSVMASFFSRAALGQFDLQQPEDLVRLLVTMARNKLADQARRQATERRGHGRLQGGDVGEMDVPGSDGTPSAVVSAREILEKVQERLTPEERLLASQRVEGREWGELAAERGTTPEALRKKHTRALDRVAQELGLDSLVDT